MENKKIVLPTTHRGLLYSYFVGIFWAPVLLVAAYLLSGYIASVYAEAGVTSLRALERANNYDDGSILIFFCILAMWICYIIAGIVALATLHEAVYGSREVNTFELDSESMLGKITAVNYRFPLGRDTRQVMFNRIIRIDVDQAGISRALGVGNLRVTLTTFTNADADETNWTIPGIENVYQVKHDLEAKLRDHEGLKIQLPR